MNVVLLKNSDKTEKKGMEKYKESVKTPKIEKKRQNAAGKFPAD